MCCSSEYMFLYAQELLFATEKTLQSKVNLKRKFIQENGQDNEQNDHIKQEQESQQENKKGNISLLYSFYSKLIISFSN